MGIQVEDLWVFPAVVTLLFIALYWGVWKLLGLREGPKRNAGAPITSQLISAKKNALFARIIAVVVGGVLSIPVGAALMSGSLTEQAAVSGLALAGTSIAWLFLSAKWFPSLPR